MNPWHAKDDISVANLKPDRFKHLKLDLARLLCRLSGVDINNLNDLMISISLLSSEIYVGTT